MSSQAVWIRSLTSLPLLPDFLKHSCNLSSVKGHPPLRGKKRTRAVTRQQENFMTSASSGRVYQILFTPSSHKKRLTHKSVIQQKDSAEP